MSLSGNWKIVESLGENVNEVKKGDIVIPTVIADCGECKDCQSEKSNQCSNLPFNISPWMPRDGTSRFTDTKEEVVYHFVNVSSFSEYTVVDIAHLTKIDPSVPPNKACLVSCGIPTGVGAACKTAKVEAGSTVAIFEMGSIGLVIAEGARLCGASRIIGVNLNSDKFELGMSLLAVFSLMDCRPLRTWESSCRKGWGKTIVLGVDTKSDLVFPSYEMLQSRKSVMGSLFGNCKPKSDLPVLLQRYMNKVL